MSNKLFWNTVKASMTNEGILTDDKIVIERENDVKIKLKGKINMLDIKAENVINDEEILVEMFNNHDISIIENSIGAVPIELGTPLGPNLDQDTVEKILKHYGNHPSIIEIEK